LSCHDVEEARGGGGWGVGGGGVCVGGGGGGGGGEVQQIQLRTENRENGDLGAVAT